MTAKTITQLTALAAADAASADVLPIVDVSDTTMAATGTTKKITLTELQSAPVSAGTANGVLYLDGSKVATSGSALTFDGTTVATAAAEAFRIKNDNGYLNFYNSANTVQTGYIQFNAATPSLFVNTVNQPFAWLTGGSEQMRLTSTGLGIGTSSPDQKLTVSGNARLSGSMFVAAANGVFFNGNNAYNTGILSDALGTSLRFYSGAAVTNMTLDSAGNLGLGVTPSTNVNSGTFVIGNNKSISYAGPLAYFDVNAYYGQVASVNADRYVTNGYATRYQSLNGVQSWFTAPSGTAGDAISFGDPKMTLDASGRLLVGKTSSSSSAAGAELFNGAGGNAAAVFVADGIFTTILNRITSDGSIVDIRRQGVSVGSISVTTSATAYNTSSDYRLKDNQQPLTGSGEFIDALKPKTWDWKVDGSRGVGFIAHEVQEVSPTSVVGEKDATRIEQYEISPAVPAVLDEEGNVITPAVEAVMGEREVPAYQAMEYGSAEFIANIVAELQSLRKRVAQLEAR